MSETSYLLPKSMSKHILWLILIQVSCLLSGRSLGDHHSFANSEVMFLDTEVSDTKPKPSMFKLTGPVPQLYIPTSYLRCPGHQIHGMVHTLRSS